MKWITLFTVLLGFGVLAQEAEPDFFELRVVSLTGESRFIRTLSTGAFGPRLSHDQEKVAMTVYGSNSADIWVFSLNNIDQTITFPNDYGDFNEYPVWSLNDETIYYIADFENEQSLFRRQYDGNGSAELVAMPARAPESWSAVSETLSYITLNDGDYAIWSVAANTNEVEPFIEREGSLQHSSVYSADGKWVAYTSDETGQFEVWVEPVPLTGERFQMTKQGGGHPVWSPDGTRLYYALNNQLYYLEVQANKDFSFDAPIETSISGFYQPTPVRRQFEILADGISFLILQPGYDE